MKKVYKLLIFYNIFTYKELCCSYCHYLKIHEEHKVLSIDDKEMLKKENILTDNSSNEFYENIQIIIN